MINGLASILYLLPSLSILGPESHTRWVPELRGKLPEKHLCQGTCQPWAQAETGRVSLGLCTQTPWGEPAPLRTGCSQPAMSLPQLWPQRKETGSAVVKGFLMSEFQISHLEIPSWDCSKDKIP